MWQMLLFGFDIEYESCYFVLRLWFWFEVLDVFLVVVLGLLGKPSQYLMFPADMLLITHIGRLLQRNIRPTFRPHKLYLNVQQKQKNHKKQVTHPKNHSQIITLPKQISEDSRHSRD